MLAAARASERGPGRRHPDAVVVVPETTALFVLMPVIIGPIGRHSEVDAFVNGAGDLLGVSLGDRSSAVRHVPGLGAAVLAALAVVVLGSGALVA
jgi:hypothetical protein